MENVTVRGRVSAPLECCVVPIIIRVYAEILKHEKRVAGISGGPSVEAM
jgi:hypothetical protein